MCLHRHLLWTDKSHLQGVQTKLLWHNSVVVISIVLVDTKEELNNSLIDSVAICLLHKLNDDEIINLIVYPMKCSYSEC